MVEETVADDDMIMIRGAANSAAVTVLLRGANDHMLDEMDRSLHDAFCIVKRVLESGSVVPGACHKLCCCACIWSLDQFLVKRYCTSDWSSSWLACLLLLLKACRRQELRDSTGLGSPPSSSLPCVKPISILQICCLTSSGSAMMNESGVYSRGTGLYLSGL